MRIGLFPVAIALFGAATCFWPRFGLAGRVVLENGDAFTGEVSQTEGDKVVLETDYADPIRLKISEIRSITTEEPVEVHLESGEVLKGRLRAGEEGRIVVESGEGRDAVPIDWSQVRQLNPPPPEEPDRWEGSFALGGHLQSGNTERKGAAAEISGLHRTDRDRFSIRARYTIESQESRLIERSIFGAMKYRYFLTQAFYWYAGVELLSDDFRDLVLRTVVGPGIGYQVWDEPEKSLSFEAGLTYFSENFDDAEDQTFLTARLGAHFEYLLFDAVKFSESLVVYPDLENTGDYQLHNEASLSRSLGGNWSLKLTNITEYDSAPPEDVKKTDSSWIASVQYDF